MYASLCEFNKVIRVLQSEYYLVHILPVDNSMASIFENKPSKLAVSEQHPWSNCCYQMIVGLRYEQKLSVTTFLGYWGDLHRILFEYFLCPVTLQKLLQIPDYINFIALLYFNAFS